MNTRLKRGGVIGAITAIGISTVAFVGGWEGLKLYAYQDVIGVWTACYGETKGIKRGMKFTKEQCDLMFLDSLTRHEAGMRKCLKNPDGLPEPTYVAVLSLTYNIGTGGFCKSSVRRYLNAGNIQAACNRIPAFNRAGGKVVRGLTNRRAKEQALCLRGVK